MSMCHSVGELAPAAKRPKQGKPSLKDFPATTPEAVGRQRNKRFDLAKAEAHMAQTTSETIKSAVAQFMEVRSDTAAR